MASKGNVTVVVCEFEGFENRNIVVLEGHIDEKEAIRQAKDHVRQGWCLNYNLPYDAANVIAEAYTYSSTFNSVIPFTEQL